MKKKQEGACALNKTSIGGQALMEGIMMRGPKKSAMAVRNPKGEMVIEEFETGGAKRLAICRWPIIRGIFGYIDSMAIGYKCLMRSAEISGLDELVEEKPQKKDRKSKKKQAAAETEEVAPCETVADATDAPADTSAEEASKDAAEGKKAEDDKIPAWVMTLLMVGSVVLGLLIAVGLFIWAPSKLFDLLCKGVPGLQGFHPAVNSLIKSAFEGILKVLILVLYMWAISFEKDIRRTFMYHGGEHKTIFCYEAGMELTVENVRKMGRFHPRCGTSFLILMLLVGMLISFFIDPITLLFRETVLPTGLRALIKLLLLPFIVGLGYELIKFAGRHDNWLTRVISAPGVWLQHLTVLEPTDDMIECAIEAVKQVIPDDGSDAW